MEQCGSTLSPRDFYWAVNLAFHSAESEYYEREHARMISAMAEKWSLLLEPLRARPAKSIHWLDVGCGPGVLGNVVARILGDTIQQGVFLDPNANMLHLCEGKARQWHFPSRFVRGTIFELGTEEQFDLITCNSVLHHIVEIDDFCGRVAELLAANGLFAHCYDPRRGAASDKVLSRRSATARWAHAWQSAGHRFGELFRKIRRSPSFTKIIEAEANRELLKSRAIAVPLDIRSIWAVTDFHVPNQPGSFGEGLSPAELGSSLHGLKLQQYFTYCFFGRENIVSPFRQMERQLFNRREEHGALFGASWSKRPSMETRFLAHE
jgi:ubiquinone/menaquinone biosynthesis C-methylase UbiE